MTIQGMWKEVESLTGDVREVKEGPSERITVNGKVNEEKVSTTLCSEESSIPAGRRGRNGNMRGIGVQTRMGEVGERQDPDLL